MSVAATRTSVRNWGGLGRKLFRGQDRKMRQKLCMMSSWRVVAGQ